MRDGQGYEILHSGVPRTFRDRRETALEAAPFAKSNAKGDIIELRDGATGDKLVMLADGRVGQGVLPNRRATYRTITPQLAAHFAISLDREILIIFGHQGQCPAGIPP